MGTREKAAGAAVCAALILSLAGVLPIAGCAPVPVPVPIPLGDFWDSSQDEGYITVTDGLISDKRVVKLEKTAEEIAEDYGCGVYFSIIEGYEESELEEHVAELWDERGLGIGDSKSGIILVMSTFDGYFTVLAHGDAREVFTTERIAEIEDEFAKQATTNRLSEAVEKYLSMCRETLEHYEATHSPLGSSSKTASAEVSPGSAIVI